MQVVGRCRVGSVTGTTTVTTASEWEIRGWSVLGSVPLMGSGVFGWSLLMARWIDSKAFYALFPSIPIE